MLRCDAIAASHAPNRPPSPSAWITSNGTDASPSNSRNTSTARRRPAAARSRTCGITSPSSTSS